jgi:DNA-binding GntR family transcriptional regulator
MLQSTRPSLVEIDDPELIPGSLPDRIYGILKQQILTCAIMPGTRLTEMDLCGDLGVSRTPLREALNRLGHEGLLQVRPNRGYRVMPVTVTHFQHLGELRRAVEPQVAALAAAKALPEDLALMRDAADLQYEPGNRDSLVAYCRQNCVFHLAIARSTGNPLLSEIVMSALDKHQQPAYMGLLGRMSAKEPTGEHHAIVDAIQAGNSDLARALMDHHIARGVVRISDAILAGGFEEDLEDE